jgi:hypothetical protein
MTYITVLFWQLRGRTEKVTVNVCHNIQALEHKMSAPDVTMTLDHLGDLDLDGSTILERTLSRR